MSTFYTKKGNTAIAISTVLSDANGAVSLSGATVRFKMRQWNTVTGPINPLNEPAVPRAGTAKVDAAATPDPDQSANKGKVTYAWQAADVDTPGLFACEWEVTFAGGAKATYPRTTETPSFDSVRIWPNLT
jgi:hypothetical protein